MLTLGSYLILTPTPSTDYRTKEEVAAAWASGKSFQRPNGKLIDRKTILPLRHNFSAVEFRFNKGTRMLVVNMEEL